ncbi:uncharacterized protein A1O5_11620 [Cladophialophora psammophila CBS 110553]|uniref:Uncharacterized protein n=1 Tax=Cladophialophora psammophila CBS 110553 TaxID=1182543 RepID=W9WYH5_9EURO|nr:uncharacterized protein A1O5_11620 [Cladophialophora psammophila CBS 110553]EXJ63299.1 hypothetical protein A1O5_11620 [Cladophialophora psammophila CBS 110553]
MGRFEGKVPSVTDGAFGMGLAAVELLAQESAKVALADIQWELAQKNAKSLSDSVLPFHLNEGDANLPTKP